MSALSEHADGYLRLRRALGFKLVREGQWLGQLVAYVHAAGETTLTSQRMIEWAGLPTGVQPIQWARRLSIARSFAAYLKTIEPATEIPPRDVFGARQRRPAPYLWSQPQILHLLDGARALRPALHAASCETLFGLLAVSGMRVGEALALDRADVDLEEGVIFVTRNKSMRSRLVPLHPTATEQLRRYVARRDRLCPRPVTPAFFVGARSGRLGYQAVCAAFVQVTTASGLRTARARPRIHGLRHSFTVNTLISWQRSGADVPAWMPALSDYLGHAGPAGTYWYLSATPELLSLAAQRLDQRPGGQR